MAGLGIAFEKFIPALGMFRSKWIGLYNYIYLFEMPDFWQVFANTVIIACLKIAASLFVPILFALLLNEARTAWFKRTVQTIVYLPHFLSWVILGTIITTMFSINGIVNQFITAVIGHPIMILTSNVWFRPLLIVTDQWKEFGFSAIIYLAAITNINPQLYEAAVIDGATRLQQTRFITLPGITSTIVLMATLSLGNVLNAGFDQIFNLYNYLVLDTVDIIDTYIYRIGFVNAQFGLATAAGLMKSIISLVLIIVSYSLADRFANYRIF